MNKVIVGYATAGAIALASMFGLGVSMADAVKIVTDKEAAKVYCTQLIEGEKSKD